MFMKKAEAVMAEEFGEATLEAEISIETGEVQWMRQGVVIQPGPRHTLAQNGCKRSLTIHNLTISDRGTYRCETLHDRTQVKLNVEREYRSKKTFKPSFLWGTRGPKWKYFAEHPCVHAQKLGC